MPDEPRIKRAVSFIDGQNLCRHVKDAFGHHLPISTRESLPMWTAPTAAGSITVSASTPAFPAQRGRQCGTSTGAGG